MWAKAGTYPTMLTDNRESGLGIKVDGVYGAGAYTPLAAQTLFLIEEHASGRANRQRPARTCLCARYIVFAGVADNSNDFT